MDIDVDVDVGTHAYINSADHSNLYSSTMTTIGLGVRSHILSIGSFSSFSNIGGILKQCRPFENLPGDQAACSTTLILQYLECWIQCSVFMLYSS